MSILSQYLLQQKHPTKEIFKMFIPFFEFFFFIFGFKDGFLCYFLLEMFFYQLPTATMFCFCKGQFCFFNHFVKPFFLNLVVYILKISLQFCDISRFRSVGMLTLLQASSNNYRLPQLLQILL